MLSLRLQQQQHALRTSSASRHVWARPRTVCRYRSSTGGHRDEGYVVYTSNDPKTNALEPASQSVLMCLLEKQLEFQERRVNMADKSQEFVELYHSIVPDQDVRERVPVLVHGSKRLVDPAVIVEYLSAACAESGTPLTPPDPYVAARVKLFTQYFMDHVVPAFNHLLNCGAGEAQVQEAKAGLMRALAAVDQFLALHGAGEGLNAVGPHYGWSMAAATPEQQAPAAEHERFFMWPFFTTAEIMCTPYLSLMVHTLPDWRSMDVLQEAEDAQLHRVAGWMRACLARPSAKLTAPGRKELVEGLLEWEWSHAV